jgi:hypothetical protein
MLQKEESNPYLRKAGEPLFELHFSGSMRLGHQKSYMCLFLEKM